MAEESKTVTVSIEKYGKFLEVYFNAKTMLEYNKLNEDSNTFVNMENTFKNFLRESVEAINI